MKRFNTRHMVVYVVSLLLLGCSVEPRPITYNQDGCHFCKMNISDKRYGSELVTTKGKVYKFDAIECLINYKRGAGDESYSFQLVNTFDEPGKLHDAGQVTYLVSRQLPSPMGMYLTGFTNVKDANKALEKYKGKLYTWNELNQSFQAIRSELSNN